jgi:alpha,alpha-trehalose-phosphate synthase [UDP-forming]
VDKSGGSYLVNSGRLIVVSNRLPITIEQVDGKFRLQPSSGGVVSALVPVLRESKGCWVGWTGTDYSDALGEVVSDWSATQPYSFAPVYLTSEEKECFYHGCSNEVIWPLFHGLPSRCTFESAYWRGYCKATAKFADAVEDISQAGDFVWVHDYHLMMLAGSLRTRGFRERLAYFHHIPFPSADVFETLPWRVELLRALMQFDVLGFQTAHYLANFIECLRRCLGDVQVSRVIDGYLVQAAGRSVIVENHAISIDYRTFAADAAAPTVAAAAAAIRTRLSGTKVILGLDRLDYTKGIVERLNAFRTFLECHPEMRNRVTFVQIVVPSREDIPEYKRLKLRIETLVSKINGEYGTPGWVPVQYLYRSVPRAELLALYRAAHVALITPLKDGMNLVAKEFCAARGDYAGVLVLSEFAGAADELSNGALIVNPHDCEGVAAMLYLALHMDEKDQRARMLLMRSQIRRHDVFRWSQSFLKNNSYNWFRVIPRRFRTSSRVSGGDSLISVAPETTITNSPKGLTCGITCESVPNKYSS